MKAPIHIFLLFSLLLLSCQEQDQPTASSEYVVEGWIEAGRHPIVKLTRSIPIPNTDKDDERLSLDSLENYIVRWARITISDGEQTVTLTGHMDNAYFPPYVYTTTDMKGQPGRTYTLTVYCKDRAPIVATTTIPDRSGQLVDSLTVEPVSNSDTLFQVVAHVSIPPYPVTYYRIFTNNNLDRSQDFYPSLLGVLRSDMIADGRIDINQGRAVLRINTSEGIYKAVDYTPYFSHGDQIMVRFAQIDSTAYAFWRSFEDMLSLSRTPLFPSTVNIPKALPNAYGFWQGWNATYLSVKIPKSVDESFTISR